MKTTYSIGDLYGSAWQSAIENVSAAINLTGDALNWEFVELVALRLGVRFDENGEIVKSVDDN